MRSSIERLLLVIVIIGCSLHGSRLFAEEPAEIELSFKSTGCRYEASASFKCRARSYEELHAMIFGFENVKKEMEGICEVEKLKEDGNTQELLYRGKLLIWEAESKFERKLDPEKHIISFRMTAFESKGKLPAPRPKSSEGSWKLTQLEGNSLFLVELHESCEMEPGTLPPLYFVEAKHECLRALESVKHMIAAKSQSKDHVTHES